MNCRNCSQVIAEMLKKIPSSELSFLSDLDWNLADSRLKAPEEVVQWERTHKTLMKHISLPVEQWHFEVLSIFTTLPIDKLKTAYRV